MKKLLITFGCAVLFIVYTMVDFHSLMQWKSGTNGHMHKSNRFLQIKQFCKDVVQPLAQIFQEKYLVECAGSLQEVGKLSMNEIARDDSMISHQRVISNFVQCRGEQGIYDVSKIESKLTIEASRDQNMITFKCKDCVDNVYCNDVRENFGSSNSGKECFDKVTKVDGSDFYARFRGHHTVASKGVQQACEGTFESIGYLNLTNSTNPKNYQKVFSNFANCLGDQEKNLDFKADHSLQINAKTIGDRVELSCKDCVGNAYCEHIAIFFVDEVDDVDDSTCFSKVVADNDKDFYSTLSLTTAPSTSTFYDCSCGVGEFKFELALSTDEYPGDTSWTIKIDSGDEIVSESGHNEHLTIFIYEYCLPVGCHDFVIYDSYGDGICCGYGAGYYKGSIYGWKEVFNGGDFGFQAIEHFCGEDVCA